MVLLWDDSGELATSTIAEEYVFMGYINIT
jgi:hypothetical protein